MTYSELIQLQEHAAALINVVKASNPKAADADKQTHNALEFFLGLYPNSPLRRFKS